MSKDLISLIKEDHKKLKKLYKIGLKKDADFSEKKNAFDELSALIIAHSKSEEAAMYVPTCGIEETKRNAFEGFEEHELVELLIQEMRSEENIERWIAKFTVMCELLDHHIEEEEDEYLPLLKEVFTDEEREALGKEYKDMFERLMEVQEYIQDPIEAHMRNH